MKQYRLMFWLSRDVADWKEVTGSLSALMIVGQLLHRCGFPEAQLWDGARVVERWYREPS